MANSRPHSTDGYGMPQWQFDLPDPPLMSGWHILRRYRTEDGEHIWLIANADGQTFRWLEGEGGPEWAFRHLRTPQQVRAPLRIPERA